MFASHRTSYPVNVRHPDPHPAVVDMKLTDVMAALSDPIRVGLVRLLADDVERG